MGTCFAMKRAHEDGEGETQLLQAEEIFHEDEQSSVHGPESLKSLASKCLVEHADNFINFIIESRDLPADTVLLLIELYSKQEEPQDILDRAAYTKERIRLALFCVAKSMENHKGKGSLSTFLDDKMSQERPCPFARLAMEIAQAVVADEYYEDRTHPQLLTLLFNASARDHKDYPVRALLFGLIAHLNEQHLRRTVCQLIAHSPRCALGALRLVERCLTENELRLIYQWARIFKCNEMQTYMLGKWPKCKTKDKLLFKRTIDFGVKEYFGFDDPIMQSLLRGDPNVLERIHAAGHAIWDIGLEFTLDSRHGIGVIEFLAHAGYTQLLQSALVWESWEETPYIDAAYKDWDEDNLPQSLRALQAAIDEGHSRIVSELENKLDSAVSCESIAKYVWEWGNGCGFPNLQNAIKYGYEKIIWRLLSWLDHEGHQKLVSDCIKHSRFEIVLGLMEHTLFDDYLLEDIFNSICEMKRSDFLTAFMKSKKFVKWLIEPYFIQEFGGKTEYLHESSSPLLLAVKRKDHALGIIKTLLELGARDYPNEKDMTALRYAREHGLTEVEELLSSHAAKKKLDDGSIVTQPSKKPRLE